eukprot:14404354-Ditylum_brightwellii.AAC.1
MEKSEQNKHVVCDKDNGVDGVEDSDDGAHKHLTHLIQVENNGKCGVCDINLTYAVKNTPTLLKSE